jgi:uncharacterized protein
MRVVIDTNVLISTMIFQGRLAWLQQAWSDRKITPLVCSATIAELVQTIKRPKFRLPPNLQTEILTDFLGFVMPVAFSESIPMVRICRDPKDDIFLSLALIGKAEALVTGDADLLVLAAQFDVPILTPDSFRIDFLP